MLLLSVQIGSPESKTTVVAAAVTGFLQLNHHVVLLRIRNPDSIGIETFAQLEAFHLHD
jgi:hypothetical protein